MRNFWQSSLLWLAAIILAVFWFLRDFDYEPVIVILTLLIGLEKSKVTRDLSYRQNVLEDGSLHSPTGTLALDSTDFDGLNEAQARLENEIEAAESIVELLVSRAVKLSGGIGFIFTVPLLFSYFGDLRAFGEYLANGQPLTETQEFQSLVTLLLSEGKSGYKELLFGYFGILFGAWLFFFCLSTASCFVIFNEIVPYYYCKSLIRKSAMVVGGVDSLVIERALANENRPCEIKNSRVKKLVLYFLANRGHESRMLAMSDTVLRRKI